MLQNLPPGAPRPPRKSKSHEPSPEEQQRLEDLKALELQQRQHQAIQRLQHSTAFGQGLRPRLAKGVELVGPSLQTQLEATRKGMALSEVVGGAGGVSGGQGQLTNGGAGQGQLTNGGVAGNGAGNGAGVMVNGAVGGGGGVPVGSGAPNTTQYHTGAGRGSVVAGASTFPANMPPMSMNSGAAAGPMAGLTGGGVCGLHDKHGGTKATRFREVQRV